MPAPVTPPEAPNAEVATSAGSTAGEESELPDFEEAEAAYTGHDDA